MSYIIYESWKTDTLWPPTLIDFSVYIFVVLIWIWTAFEFYYLPQFLELQTEKYFAARLPKLLTMVLAPSLLVIVIIFPTTLIVHTKLVQYDWEFPPAVRTATNSAVGFITTMCLIYIWFILFEFKFQECVFHLNLQSAFSYADGNGNANGTSPHLNFEPSNESTDLLTNDAPYSNIVETFAQLEAQGTIIEREFWLKQRRFLGNPFKVTCFIVMPIFCGYVATFYWCDRYFNRNVTPFVQLTYLATNIVGLVLCGQNISKYTDSIYLRGIT